MITAENLRDIAIGLYPSLLLLAAGIRLLYLRRKSRNQEEEAVRHGPGIGGPITGISPAPLVKPSLPVV